LDLFNQKGQQLELDKNQAKIKEEEEEGGKYNKAS
jgi:hypothetical protein